MNRSVCATLLVVTWVVGVPAFAADRPPVPPAPALTVAPARVPDVATSKDVLVAARWLRYNHVLEEHDLTHAPVRLTNAHSRYLEEKASAVGKRVLRAVQSGMPITDDLLGEPYVIRRGARVTIAYATGPLSIQTGGIARDDGAIGSAIRITNSESRRELWGQVVNGDTVQVGP